MKNRGAAKGDSVFRFDLQLKGRKRLYDDMMVELVREQLCNILDVAVLTAAGKEIRIDGFKFLDDKKNIFGLHKKVPS
jgi:hypothetical protein